MARASLKPIPLGEGVSFESNASGCRFKGPKGSILLQPIEGIDVSLNGAELVLSYSGEVRNKAMLGLAVALLTNAITGVTEGFQKTLTLRGTGFKVQKEGQMLNLSLGFSHPVVFPLPDGIEVEIIEPRSRDDKDWIADVIIKGIDKHLVGQVAANLRRLKPPEPYKGKGIRYKDEYVRHKLGKRAVGAE